MDEPSPFVTTTLVIDEPATSSSASSVQPPRRGSTAPWPPASQRGTPGRGRLDAIAELVDAYHDLPLGGTDASLILLAERHKATRIATLDHRHFAVVRAKAEALEILPVYRDRRDRRQMVS